jgi:hypothetical protein
MRLTAQLPGDWGDKARFWAFAKNRERIEACEAVGPSQSPRRTHLLTLR